MFSALLQGFAQTYYTYDTPTANGTDSTFSPVLMVLGLIALVIVIAGMWKTFVKAGQPGWASLIPFYNTYILLKMVNKPTWWLILFFIPIVNLVVSVLVYNELSKAFGKSTGFTLLFIFFPYIASPILGFGDAKYTNPAGGSNDHKPAAPAATPDPTE
jgi:hypothetical protein